jgi:CxxC motif-containing protein (DUF1111 family)
MYKMDKVLFSVFIMMFLPLLFVSCEKMIPPAPKDEDVLAGTIPGLSQQQEHEHLIGDEAFGKVFSVEEGLGPVFVQNSCASCHVGNGKGHPVTMVTRFAKKENGVTDYLTQLGGPQLQPKSIPGYLAENIPTEANVITHRLAPAVMGLGYIAALSDASILKNADPNDLDGDGISGRANYVEPTDFFIPLAIHEVNNGKYIGRFGKKAEKITIIDQVVFALKQDIGITSDFDMDDIYNSELGINTGDKVGDPEVSASFVHSIVFYMRTLKAPQRRNLYDTDVIEGEKLFKKIGCENCHKSSFVTDKTDIAALSYQTFYPYSDFLLHDMGELLDDGYPEGISISSEWRTPPLWGIGLARDSQGGQLFLLHDGRANSIESAITFHGGEAEQTRTNFKNLTENEKLQIVKFIESL